jgi:hypothetical protein
MGLANKYLEIRILIYCKKKSKKRKFQEWISSIIYVRIQDLKTDRLEHESWLESPHDQRDQSDDLQNPLQNSIKYKLQTQGVQGGCRIKATLFEERKKTFQN